jgi:hypothetical protein
LRLFPKVIIASLFFGSSNGLLTLLPSALFRYLLGIGVPISQIGYYNLALTLVGFVTGPILMFLLMYFLGRNIDLAAEYGGALVSLIIGLAVGSYAGFLVAIVAFFPDAFSTGSQILVILVVSILRTPVELAFVGFSGLALRYFVGGRRPGEVVENPA